MREEFELHTLQMDILDAWNTYPLPHTGAALEEWVEKYLRPYMDKLCYKHHGPRGHPNLDYQTDGLRASPFKTLNKMTNEHLEESE